MNQGFQGYPQGRPTRDAGGSWYLTDLTTGAKLTWKAPMNGIFTKWELKSDATLSIVIDVWKTTADLYDAGATHPVTADSVAGSDLPTLSSGVIASSTQLVGWTQQFSTGDEFRFNINSVTAGSATFAELHLGWKATS